MTSDILTNVQRSATRLHEAGYMDAAEMAAFDLLCRAYVQDEQSDTDLKTENCGDKRNDGQAT